MEEKNPLKMKVTELKAELGRRGLSQTGLKFDLAQRLQSAMDVEEFGALPSLTNLAQSSSSPRLAPVPERDSTEDSNAPAQSPPTSSCESSKGQPPDEQPKVLEVAAETEGTEGAKQAEQPQTLGSPNAVLGATEIGGIAPPDTENTLTSEETLRCGEKEGDPDEVNGDGVDKNKETDILGATGKMPKTVGERDVERGGVGAGGAIDGQSRKKESGATTTENEGIPDKPRPTTDSSTDETEKDAEGCVVSGESAMLLPLDSCNDKEMTAAEQHSGGAQAAADPLLLPELTNPTIPPTNPRKGVKEVRGHDSAQTGERAEQPDEEQNGKQGDEATPEDSKDALSPPDTQEGKDASQLTKAKQDANPELAPVSPLPCDHVESTNGGEVGSHQEEKMEGEKSHDTRAEANAGSGVLHGGAAGCDDHGQGGKADSKNGEEMPGAGMVEDCREAKLLKRKQRFMTTPSTKSTEDEQSVKAGNTRFATNLPSETVLERPSKPTSIKRLAASEVAAKMARRSERFGVKITGSSVPSPLRDPRGSFFAESEGMSEGNSKADPPTSAAPGAYFFDPLPQRQKRARTTATSPCKDEEAPAKRKAMGSGIAGGTRDESDTATMALAPGSTLSAEAAATSNRLVAKERHRTNKTGTPLPPSTSGEAVPPASKLGVLGARHEPKLSATAAPERNGGGPFSTPSTSSASASSPRGGATIKEAPKRVGHGGEVSKLPNGTAPSRTSRQSAGRDEEAMNKAAAQAAKMAERRKRFAEDPRAPSFR